ncbi:hypothetical protein PHSY_007375 [Pseudozyma hubeiensis SY62]|uniref:Uncharacterized protein n=1 Tax=Pseudozyma hubeiensis (strain SY62) TaxID=1305764 RepID=R9PEU4_PSEHS|nr:hypothetical protein PHSY_007375 [Pseudozyma hubeiensis SY62]GAC99772.1 hypothetical protein PHSY_007375 [Pseudozyma hubeiensis SY62]
MTRQRHRSDDRRRNRDHDNDCRAAANGYLPSHFVQYPTALTYTRSEFRRLSYRREIACGCEDAAQKQRP